MFTHTRPVATNLHASSIDCGLCFSRRYAFNARRRAMTSLPLREHKKQHAQQLIMDVLQPGLPELQQQQHWEDRVFDTVWSVGRAFGFQAFNQASPQAASSRPAAEGSGIAVNSVQWVPATIFLVSDHLSHMLVRTSMQRYVFVFPTVSFSQ